MSSVEEFFHQLYANVDLALEPASGGRQMNGHFATRSLDAAGQWKPLKDMFNCSADISPTGGQMPRLVGLAHASRMYREVSGLKDTPFSNNGNEVAWGTIGNASSAEGLFWEAINAVGVLQAPLVMSIWDDGYGISVPNEFQVTKGNLTELLAGFVRAPGTQKGYDLHTVRGWDYPALLRVYQQAAATARTEHVPQIIHVIEVTQPQGHSTSGSHERYKSKERLAWEEEFDCLRRLRLLVLEEKLATPAQLDAWEAEETQLVRDLQRRCWELYRTPVDAERAELLGLLEKMAVASGAGDTIRAEAEALRQAAAPFRRDFFRVVANALFAARADAAAVRAPLIAWRDTQDALQRARYGDNLFSLTARSPLKVALEPAVQSQTQLNGFEVLNRCFDAALARDPAVCIFGEDVGRLGDVNQGCAGLQEKYGALRVADTGIREATIMGQAIGMAMRGLRPVVEIQYLDYILYALQIMSDDLATVRWRTRGGQMAPVIVRTRGHRLEGVWHSGSPMAGILGLCRGIHVCVPRNMVQAAGMYNTLLSGDDPAVVVEVLNGYRSKETLPSNVGTFKVPLGVPDVLRVGEDITVVTYGACVKVVQEAAEQLAEAGIQVEIVDVQTLLPFDVHGVILASLKKTSRVVFVDEDVPGGATAFMMQKALTEQGGFQWLDSAPVVVAAQEHRPAYGSDGDYWSKPSRETVFEAVYSVMAEADPARFPNFLKA